MDGWMDEWMVSIVMSCNIHFQICFSWDIIRGRYKNFQRDKKSH